MVMQMLLARASRNLELLMTRCTERWRMKKAVVNLEDETKATILMG